MIINLKWIETVLLLIVAIRIDAQNPAAVKKDELTVWYPSKALDVWTGKKNLLNIITNDFFSVLNGVALNPQEEWRPQTKIDPERIPGVLRDGKVVEIGDEDDYEEDYDDVETDEYNDDNESRRKNNSAKYGQY